MDRSELFTDGEAYERMMGRWSRLTGETFLAWLDLPKGLRWLDVGCGNGAFTEEIITRCAPATVMAIDPSNEQLAFARTRSEDGEIRNGRCAETVIWRWHFRCGYHGAGACVSTRPGEGGRGDDTRRAPRRLGCHLHVGYSERRITDHADIHRDRIIGVDGSGPAQPGSVAARSHARLLRNGRARGY